MLSFVSPTPMQEKCAPSNPPTNLTNVHNETQLALKSRRSGRSRNAESSSAVDGGVIGGGVGFGSAGWWSVKAAALAAAAWMSLGEAVAGRGNSEARWGKFR
ncbi:hypothetical protein IEQ34_015066 [Dendrobium chrysotoxum]|uniref:Uncharacterized protein n=1 Tax=Dendrobium chrysotoxum TaxID=161865 RepID=A0AAV7GNV9_DENCH|nr:hypothetical protein IEQ34_015066 [Dendrobium chrysotoxum]